MDFGEELIKLIGQNGVLGVVTALLILAVVYLARDRQKVLLDRITDAKKTVEDRITDNREVFRALERSTSAFDQLADAEIARVARVKEFFDDMRRKIDEARALADDTRNLVKNSAEDQDKFRKEMRLQIIEFTKDFQAIRRSRSR